MAKKKTKRRATPKSTTRPGRDGGTLYVAIGHTCGGRSSGGRRYTLAELRARRTLATGQDADLKVETKTTRVWLSRMTREDGAECDYPVTVERKVKGRWELASRYCPAPGGGGRARRGVRASLQLLKLL